MIQVLPFHELTSDANFDSQQGNHILNLFEGISATTVIKEPNYIDKDYLIDYQNFHCRSFEEIPRKTTRYHFFTGEVFTQEDYNDCLINNNASHFNSNYLGFTVVKPLKNKYGKNIFGRSIIDITRKKDYDERQYNFLKYQHNISLNGIDLDIKGIPYQTQDQRVCACATVAIWTSLFPLNNSFDIPIKSPSEITKDAVTTTSIFRSFPSSGLNLQQVISYYKLVGLDVEPIILRDEDDDGTIITDPNIVQEIVKAYINCNIPLLATLTLKRSGAADTYHAVVISGYKLDDEDNISCFYVHDDSIGPYTETTLVSNYTEWSNEWTTEYGYSLVRLDKILIPIYPKLRLTFPRIYAIYRDIQNRRKNLDFELNLFQINDYKTKLLSSNIVDKINILSIELPKYIWVISAKYDNNYLYDYVLDATSVFPNKILEVQYSND